MPTIDAPAELREGLEVDFNCSTPYACPQGTISLKWHGQDPARSVTSNLLKLEPTGIKHLETLHMALSWQDHGRTLSCQLSVANHRIESKVHLQVQCECTRGRILVTEHTSAAPQWKPAPSPGRNPPP